jgi:hypothetical protein
MRNLCFILGLFLLPAALRAGDFRPVIRREAAKCAAAWQRGDYAGILASLPPPVIRNSGGRAAVLREIKDLFAQARSLGVERLEAVPGPPSVPRQFGPWLVTLIPLKAVLHHAHLDVTQTTQVLGLSPDKGKHWFFVLLHQTTQAELDAWFPELAGKIPVPDDPAPQIEAVF